MKPYAAIVCCFFTTGFSAMVAGCGSSAADGGQDSRLGAHGSGGTTGVVVAAGGAGGGFADGEGGGTGAPACTADGGQGGASVDGCMLVAGLTPPAEDQVTGLEFTASSNSSPPAPSLHVLVTDAERAQDVFAATLALPVFPPGTIACPFDFGVTYKLAFSLANGNTLEVSANPSGCQQVSIPGTCLRRTADASVMANDYWSTIAQDLGIPEAQIYPYSSSAP